MPFVIAENAEKVEPHLATYRRLHSMTSEISQLLQVHVLLCIEQLDELFHRRRAHLEAEAGSDSLGRYQRTWMCLGPV